MKYQKIKHITENAQNFYPDVDPIIRVNASELLPLILDLENLVIYVTTGQYQRAKALAESIQQG